MLTIRQYHSYIGLFTAPSVLLFALTGAFQLYSLHEAHGQYVPPAAIEKLSSVHKDQLFALSDHHKPSTPANMQRTDAGGAPAPDQAGDDKPATSTLILKGFFLFIALSLSGSTLLGVWMGLTQTRRKRTAWGLLAAGTFIPMGLLLIA